MENKWYQKTWFICFLFAFWWLYGIPLIIGIILLVLKDKQEKEIYKQNHTFSEENASLKAHLEELGYEDYAKVKDMISAKNQELDNINTDIRDFNNTISKLHEEIESLTMANEKLAKQQMTQTNKLTKSKQLYKSVEYCINTFLTDDKSENLLSFNDGILYEELCPNVILKLHCMDMKDLKKAYRDNDKAINSLLETYSSRYTTKANKTIYSLMVIALRAELQNILYNLKYEKLDNCIAQVKNICAKYLKIAGDGNQSIAGTLTKFIGEIEYLFINAVKIEYNYYVKKEQARQEQLAIKEQMKQEAEERRALETEKKKIELEENKYKSEIEKIKTQLQVALESEKSDLNARILQLESQLSDIIIKKDEITNLQNGKAGNVYIISNLGSFGDNVFKIGMTRRLNPQERVDELGSASVPFKFDVHSFIFSEDAVGMENKLHEMLNNKRVNKVNLRKEFFYATIDELENLVAEIDPAAEFNRTMLAEEFHQSQSTDESYTTDYVYSSNDEI